MKNVTVFGGAGFLGEYLVKELVKNNYCVTVCDIHKPANLVKDSTFKQVDILNEKAVKESLEGDVDYVYNLAGFANLDEAIKNPKLTMQLNIIGNINILEACTKINIKRFIYASSAYAVSNKGSFYGISKLASEKIIEEYKNKFRIPFTILRYGSVYAEHDYDNNYLYSLIKQAVLTKKIIHKSDGEEEREYIHASDAAQLSVQVMNESFENQYVILTGMEKMKRKDLFSMIQEMLNGEVEIFLNEGTIGNHYKRTPYSFQPTVSKKLVANPYIDMGQGLLECIKAVHENNQATKV